MKYGTNSEVIEAFFDQSADGPSLTGAGNIYWDDKKTLYSYGRHFPLAYKHQGGAYLFNGDKYSNSTARHQSDAATHRQEGRGDITISFSALEAAGIEYNSKSLHIIDTDPDQQEGFYFDSNFYGESAKEEAEQFIRSAPMGATVSFRSWEDKQGERQRAPTRWHRPAAALLRWSAWTETKSIYSDDPDHRWETVDIKEVKHPATYFILGMDEGSYFISQLPKKAASVGEAYDILKPEAIHQAEAEGHSVQRQGEWFFYQVMNGKTAKTVYRQLTRNFDLTDASNREGAAHTATRGGQLGSVAFKTIEKDQVLLFGKRGGQQIIVSGQIRHSEGDHAQLKLSTTKEIKIFAAHVNTALESWSSSGGVD